MECSMGIDAQGLQELRGLQCPRCGKLFADPTQPAAVQELTATVYRNLAGTWFRDPDVWRRIRGLKMVM